MASPTISVPTLNPDPAPLSRNLPADSNGSATRASFPVSRTRLRSRRATAFGVSVAVVLLAGGAAWLVLSGTKPASHELRTYTVHYDTLQVQINERGRVESAHNNDLICRIKARTPDSPIATSITWVIDEGSLVEKGQKLMELDASALEDQRKNHLVEFDKAHTPLSRTEGIMTAR